ncbi:MAG TPA: sulfotransferase [Phycisphaerales bacterium]|nr:sulfotransferase [Phycisphaerales bacterium]HMP35808.1 sulfotransferase [Phycisphaerales bacterium]
MFAPQLPAQQLLQHATELHRRGQFPAAVEVYRQLLRSFPTNPEILDKLGSALTGMGQVEEGRRHLERAIQLAPTQPIIHHDLAVTYRREGKFAKAEECLDRALKLAPRHPVYTAAKAELFLIQDDLDRAMKVLEPVRRSAAEHPAVALVFAAYAPRIGAEREAAEAIGVLLTRADLAPVIRLRLLFAQCYCLDYAGRFDDAWTAASAGNLAVAATWDADAHSRTIDASIEAWTPEAVRLSPSSSADGSRMTFVMGLPRCGTSLVARMLSQIPGVVNAGEPNELILAARDLQGDAASGTPIFTRPAALTAARLNERANAYLEQLGKIHPGEAHYVDRMPMNFLNLGLVAKLFPGAKFIVCGRDRLDLGVACYTHLFAANYPFMYEAERIGRFIRDAERLQRHWKAVVPAPIHEVAFEDLVARPEATARSIVEFVGKPWDERVLEPARKWIATVTLPDGSMRDIVPDGRVGIAADYEAHTAPLRAGLGDAPA